jgi:putative PEP-CTERM system histidine kinase
VTLTISLSYTIPAAIAAIAACVLAAFLLIRHRSNSWIYSIVAVLGSVALSQAGNALVWSAPDSALVLRRLSLMGELMLPVAILYSGLTLTRPGSASKETAARWRARVVFFFAVALCGLIWIDSALVLLGWEGSVLSIGVGALGRVGYFFIVIALALGLAQLEQILRAMRDPLRYQLKFVLIGLGALAGYEIYQASSLLMLRLWRSDETLAGALATLVSIGVLTYGFGRSRLREATARVYVSPQVVYGSITFIVVGLYLLSVGLLGEWVRYVGAPVSVGLSSLVVFLAAVGLVIVLFSRTSRAELRQFVGRHFYRSKYDYRTKWIEVTDAFRTTDTVESILDQLLHLLSRTFGAAKISVWLQYQADGRFHQARSVNAEPPPPPIESRHPIVQRMTSTDDAVEVAQLFPRDEDGAFLQNDAFLVQTQAVLCVPIRSQGALIAFVALSADLHGEKYRADDRDLLRAIGHHVGVVLSHAQLAEERRSSAELEALHRFSAFCLHDLKNLTARLSLIVQNAAVHGHDPGFQEVALRTVSTTVEKMMALMTKLSGKSIRTGSSELVDIQSVIAEAAGSMTDGPFAKVRIEGGPVPPISVVREQLHQTLLNLILNARHAAGANGEVQVTTETAAETVVITVSDTGPGIPPERLQTVFQPFQTTTPGGLGIGLYQCKQIIESHQGTIRIDSEPGHGTQVRIELPLANTPRQSVVSS